MDLSITPVMERSGNVGNGGGEKDGDTLSRDIRTLTRNSNITITPSQPNVSSHGNRSIIGILFVQTFVHFFPLFKHRKPQYLMNNGPTIEFFVLELNRNLMLKHQTLLLCQQRVIVQHTMETSIRRVKTKKCLHSFR